MTTFDEELTIEGKMFVHNFLMNRSYSMVDEFFDTVSEAVFLAAVNYNINSGYMVVDELLSRYCDYIGLDIHSYNNLVESKKATVCMKLYDRHYDSMSDFVEVFHNTVKKIQASSNSSSGGGGGGGSSYRTFEYTVNATDEVQLSFDNVCYESDVDFIVAAYDGEELIGLKKTTLEANKNHSFDVTLSLNRLAENLSVKRFVWSADGNCTPVRDKMVGNCVYKNTVTFPSSDFIEYITPNVIKYESAESAKEIYYQLSDNYELYVNGKLLNSWGEGVINQYLSYRNTDIILEDKSGTKEGLDNIYDRVYVNYYVDAVVDSVLAKDNGATIYFKYSSNGNARLQYENEYTDVKFIKDGKEISVEDLKEYDVLTMMYDINLEAEDSESITVYVDDTTVIGTVNEIDEEKNSIYINGVEYLCEDYIWACDYSLEESYNLYLNCFGNIVYDEEDISSRMYGVIVGMYRSNLNERPVVRMITDYGELVTFECKNDWVTEEFMNIIRNATGKYVDYNTTTYLLKSELTPDNIRDLVVEYKLSGSKLSKVNYVGSANYDRHLEYKEKTNKFESYAVNETTKFVVIEDYLNDGNEVYTLTLDDFEDETVYEMYITAKNPKTNTYGFVFVIGGLSGVRAETDWAVVKGVTTLSYNDEYCYKLNVLRFDEKQNTETETVYVSVDAVREKPVAGSVVMYDIGNNGYVEDGYFYTVTNGFDRYSYLFEESMWYDNFSEMINSDVLYNLVQNSNKDVEYFFGPVYRSLGSRLEVLTRKSGDISNVDDVEIFTITDDVKSYIYDYSKRNTYRFYRGDVPYVNKNMFRPALTGAEDEMIDWSIAEQEDIHPSFALIKTVDGDVTEIVSFTENVVTFDKTETGMLTALHTDKNTITVNDVEYECDESIFAGDLEIGNEYTLYISASGKVIDIEMLDKPGNYGVIVAMQNPIEYSNPLVTFITANGKLETFECENADVVNQIKQIIADAGIALSSDEYLSRKHINAENIINLVVDYSIYDNKLSEVGNMYCANTHGLEYRENISKFDRCSVNEQTKFITVEDYLNGGSDIYTVTLSEFKDEICYDIYLYDRGVNSGSYMFGLVTGDMTAVTAHTEWAIVKNASGVIFEDEDCYKLEVLKDGKQETIYVLESAVREAPEAGSVVMYDKGYGSYIKDGKFFTVMNGFGDYQDLYNEAMCWDEFSEMINWNMVEDIVYSSNEEVQYIFAPVYRKNAMNVIELLTWKSGNCSDVNAVEAFVIRDNVKSYICDYSLKEEERFYTGDVPNTSQVLFYPSLVGAENELIDWSMVEQEDIKPNLALLKIVDGDVEEIVTFVGE